MSEQLYGERTESAPSRRGGSWRGRWARLRALAASWVLIALASFGCDPSSGSDEGAPAASANVPLFGVESGDFLLPEERSWNANPLDLPPTELPPEERLGVNQRVFAVPRDMLARAKPGRVLRLHAAHIVRLEGDLWVIREGYGPAYTIHPAYVVVPRGGRFRRGTAVIAAYRGLLKHGVVKNLLRDRVVVRFTDLGFRLSDQKLDPERVGVLPGELAPGAYAIYPTERGLQHVLLVSRGQHADGKAKWLTIGYRGDAELIDEERLQPLPYRGRFRPREGDSVRAAFEGSMVPASLRDHDSPGWFTVKRSRAGAPLLVGPGQIMPASDL